MCSALLITEMRCVVCVVDGGGKREYVHSAMTLVSGRNLLVLLIATALHSSTEIPKLPLTLTAPNHISRLYGTLHLSMHAPYLLPAVILPPPKGTKPVVLSARTLTHRSAASKATALESVAARRRRLSGQGAAAALGADGRTERGRERERERGRGRGREKEEHHSRKQEGGLGRRARSIPCAGMQERTGRRQGQRERKRERGASCRWNCSLWQRWVVCSNILQGHSTPLGRSCVKFPCNRRDGSQINCRPIPRRNPVRRRLRRHHLSSLRHRPPPPNTVQRRGALLCGFSGSAEQPAISAWTTTTTDSSVFRAYSGGDSRMSVRPAGCAQMDAEADVHVDHRVPGRCDPNLKHQDMSFRKV